MSNPFENLELKRKQQEAELLRKKTLMGIYDPLVKGVLTQLKEAIVIGSCYSHIDTEPQDLKWHLEINDQLDRHFYPQRLNSVNVFLLDKPVEMKFVVESYIGNRHVGPITTSDDTQKALVESLSQVMENF